MVFTTIAWSESQDTSAVLTQVAALADQHVTTSGDDILVPTFATNLGAVLAVGATISQAQMSSPSLRKSTLLDIGTLNIAAEPASPTSYARLFETPRPLTAGEGLRALVAESAAGAEQETVVAWLFGEPEALPAGEIQTIRLTGTTTLGAFAWTLCTLTLSQQLEAGTYAIVGMRAVSAGAIAARLVISGASHRPGVIAYDAASDIEDPIFRKGRLGSWGTFQHVYVPQVEFLSVSADTAETVHLDVVKVA